MEAVTICLIGALLSVGLSYGLAPDYEAIAGEQCELQYAYPD